MKKIVFAIYFFVFLLSAKNSFGFWVSQDNSVIFSESNDWHATNVGSPTVIKEEQLYKMWYQAVNIEGHYSIGYAESSNGINWNKRILPVLSADNELLETDVVEPTIVKYDNKYYLWYNSFESGKENYKIRVASSEDGINWTKHAEPVLVGTNDWEKAGVTDPAVIYHDGKFRMFYGGWGTPKSFRIGYAESEDGIHWDKPSNQPLSLPSLGHLNGPGVAFYDDKYHLFYHTGGDTPTHLYHVVSDNLQNWQCAEGGCEIFKADGAGFDSTMVTGPSFLNDRDRQLIFYGGSDGSLWQIGLLINELPKPPAKIIIIPGLFASWNKEAIVHQQPAPPEQWQLNPIVKDYDGLIQTFNNLGLQKDIDYFVFAYDWRKSLKDIAVDLNFFINQHELENERLKIVGHSLGGLVARAYAEEFNNQNLEQIITAGSPHQGVAQVYKPLSAGEIEESNTWLYLAQQLALQIYRQGIETNKEVINRNLPVLKDLVPTYPYLFDRYGNALDINTYQFKNDYLSNLNLLPANYELHTLTGQKGDTLFGYQLGERTLLDKIFNYYPEGRPENKIFRIGDFVVPALSAAGTNNEILTLDHGGLIRKNEALKKIMDKLDLDYEENQIVEGEATDIFPSLFLLMLSSAKLEVKINNTVYTETDGMVHIPHYQNEPFIVRAVGQTPGDYTILIGNLTADGAQWQQLNGSISETNPTEQIDEFQLNIVKDRLNLSQNNLSALIGNYQPLNQYWQSCETLLNSGNKTKLRTCLLKYQSKLIKSARQLKPEFYPDLFQNLSYLEDLYIQLEFPIKKHVGHRILQIKYQLVQRLFDSKTRIIANRQQRNCNVSKQKYLLGLAKNRLELFKKSLQDSPNINSEIYFYSIKQILAQI